MRDAAAPAPLFEDASVLVTGHGPQQRRGPGEIVRAAWLLWQHQRGLPGRPAPRIPGPTTPRTGDLYAATRAIGAAVKRAYSVWR